MTLFSGDNDDINFMSEAEAAARRRPATPAILMFFSVMVLVVLAFVWAAFSEVEQITHGEGQVVPSQEIQVLQSLEGGILSELLVQEGERVKKDQVLMRINDVQFATKEKGTEAKFLSLQARKARLEAEAGGTDFVMPADIAEKYPQIAASEQQLHASRQRELVNSYKILDDRIAKAQADLAEVGAQVNRLSENRRMLSKELEMTREMVAQRAAPKMEQMRLERELSDAAGQLNAQAERRKSLEAELQVAKTERASQKDTFRSNALKELSDVETEIAGLRQELQSIGDRVSRTELRAPVDGIVNSITVKTIGGVIEPAQKLAEIVPVADALKIIARVRPEDVAFLKSGQDVKVKITAYDSQKYGRLPGKLVRVGANSVTDKEGNIFFDIEVRTDKNHMGSAEHPLPITPGMVAQTEVIVGRRTILEYFMKPLLKARDQAFTER